MEFESGPEFVLSEFINRFGGQRPRLYQAPGRINIIGEHTDYNDGFVLPATVDLHTWAAVAPRTDRILRVHACNDGSTVSLVLSAASEPPDDRPDHAHFVEWTGPLDHPLEQGIHELRHAEWGTLALFLVPVNQVAEGFVYEAVFTRVEE